MVLYLLGNGISCPSIKKISKYKSRLESAGNIKILK
jgi:hypothetical protein